MLNPCPRCRASRPEIEATCLKCGWNPNEEPPESIEVTLGRRTLYIQILLSVLCPLGILAAELSARWLEIDFRVRILVLVGLLLTWLVVTVRFYSFTCPYCGRLFHIRRRGLIFFDMRSYMNGQDRSITRCIQCERRL